MTAKRLRNWNRASVFAIILAAGAGFDAHGQEAEAEGVSYPEPAFSRALFEEGQVIASPAEKTELLHLLVAVARGKEVDPVVKAKALAYASALSPGHETVAETNFFLTYGMPLPYYDAFAKSVDGADLGELLMAVKEADGTRQARATAFLYDIVRSIGPELVPATFAAVEVPDWAPFLTGYQSPGGSGSPANAPPGKLAKTSASIGGVFFGDKDEMRVMLVKATALPNTGQGSSIVVAGKSVPPELQSALHEMVKMFSLRNLRMPPGKRIVVEFGEGYSGADGPTGVLACALLVDSLVQGTDLYVGFAPVGDLNADGSTQPVYAIHSRLEAAMDAPVTLMAIPTAVEARLADILLIDGIEPLLKTQVFTARNFSEARALALAPGSRDAKLQEAIDIFSEIQTALDRPGGEAYLSHEKVRERLSQVVELAPNHASAKLLLLRGINRHPQKLTLPGSLGLILHAAVFLEGGSSSKYPNFGDAVSALARQRRILDSKSVDWMQAIVRYENLQRRSSSNLSPDQKRELDRQIDQARQRIDLEYEKLMSNPMAREALMRN